MKIMTIPNTKSRLENLHMLTERKTLPFNGQEQSKCPYIFTNHSLSHCPINDKSMIRKSSTIHNISTYHQINPTFYRSNKEIQPMDFRPLITHGRRKFNAIPSSSMIITKKKSPSPMNHISSNQKPLIRSIPVDIINNNRTMVISSMIPSSSLSYSSSYSSSSSTSTSSTNVGTVFLPIQVTKSQNNNSIIYSNITITNQGQRGYRYVQNEIHRRKSLPYIKTGPKIQLDDDVDKSTRISSSSSTGGEGNNNHKATLIMDSHVLRLIRRYDPVTSNTTGIRSQGSFDNTHNLWQTVVPKSVTPQPSDSSSFLLHRSLTTPYEDERPVKQPSITRLHRQEAFYEPEPPPPKTNSLRPILKYSSSRSRSEFIVQPHQNESSAVDLGPLSNESAATYQPLTPTGTRRVCSALSKSEWDLRLQQEPFPIRPPSPIFNYHQQEKESYRPVLGRSKSSTAINHIYDDDDFDEISAPIINNGSYIEKLKRVFITNPSSSNHQRNDKTDISSSFAKSSPLRNSIESEQRIITKPTSSLLNQNPLLRNQRTIDSLELVNHPNNSSLMPSSEVSYDTYRHCRLNDHDSSTTTTRPRNIAKVEPYSINTNTVRPLYQSSSSSLLQPITMTTTTVVPSKARISLNSMENTPTNSSTSSSAGSHGGMLRHSNIQHSDFLMPNPVYPIPPIQTLSNSSSYTAPPILLSESLSHGSLYQSPVVNSPTYNGRITGLTSSTNNSRQIFPSSTLGDFHSDMRTSSRLSNNNNNNLIPSVSYHYRPPSTTVINNSRKQLEVPIRSTIIEQQQQQDESINSGGQQHQSRRRFQRRKQMKRSKSVDAYQEPSSLSSSTINHDFNKSFGQQRSSSRENLSRENLSASSSSSSASLTADIERVNRTALLRYKSLDSMTFNNQKLNFNEKNNNNRRAVSKTADFDFDSDDSVCGIPKPRKTIGR